MEKGMKKIHVQVCMVLKMLSATARVMTKQGVAVLDETHCCKLLNSTVFNANAVRHKSSVRRNNGCAGISTGTCP